MASPGKSAAEAPASASPCSFHVPPVSPLKRHRTIVLEDGSHDPKLLANFDKLYQDKRLLFAE